MAKIQMEMQKFAEDQKELNEKYHIFEQEK